MSTIITILFTLLTIASGFWVEISPSKSPKCYKVTLLPHEDLLVQIQLPLIDDEVGFRFSAKNENMEQIYQKVINKKTDRITVSMDNSPKPGSIQVVYACMGSDVKNLEKKQELEKKSHLIWFAQFNHFSHEIQSKKSVQDPFQGRFERMKQRVGKLEEIYNEQSSFFATQLESQTKNEKILETALQQAYTMIVIESIVIIGMSMAYIAILKIYL